MDRFHWKGWAVGEQVHGTNIALITEPHQGEKIYSRTDGLITGCTSVALGIFTADCVPVFFTDLSRNIVGIAHAGWRGVYHGIVMRMIDMLVDVCGCSRSAIHVSVGPHIKSCCYRVGGELQKKFKLTQDHTLDLHKVISKQLTKMRIRKDNISTAPWCTAHTVKWFYSFRKEKGTENRMFSVIGII